MIKKQTVQVTMFFEDKEPIGILYQNGKREIYKIERATNEQVDELLETNKVIEE